MLYIKGMAKKATNIEIDRRIHKIYDLLLLGNSKTQIARYCAENYSVSLRQTEEYLSRARILQEQDAQLERPQWLVGAIARLADYERRASMENQLQTAIRAVEMQAKLLRFDMSACALFLMSAKNNPSSIF